MLHLKLRKKEETLTFDPDKFEPVIRSSICTGEKVAAFRNRETGHLTEIMLISSEKDMERFRSLCGIDGEIRTVY